MAIGFDTLTEHRVHDWVRGARVANGAVPADLASAEDFIFAAHALRLMETASRLVDAELKRLRKPSVDAQREIADLGKSVLGDLPERIESLRERMAGLIEKRHREAVWAVDTADVDASDDDGALLAGAFGSAFDRTRAEGIRVTQRWFANVHNFKTLVEAVAKGRAPIEFLAPNQKELDKWATQIKGGDFDSSLGIAPSYRFTIAAVSLGGDADAK